jgi:hypothetical protein
MGRSVRVRRIGGGIAIKVDGRWGAVLNPQIPLLLRGRRVRSAEPGSMKSNTRIFRPVVVCDLPNRETGPGISPWAATGQRI